MIIWKYPVKLLGKTNLVMIIPLFRLTGWPEWEMAGWVSGWAVRGQSILDELCSPPNDLGGKVQCTYNVH